MGKDDSWTEFIDDEKDLDKEGSQASFNKPIPAMAYILAGHLQAAVNTTLPHKIDLICQAGMMVNWGKHEAIQNGIRTLSRMNTAVLTGHKVTREGKEVWKVPWHPDLLDKDEKYKQWFYPWDDDFEVFKALLPDNFDKLIDREKYKLRTQYLTYSGYETLKSIFFAFAIPHVMRFEVAIGKHLDINALSVQRPTSSSFSVSQ